MCATMAAGFSLRGLSLVITIWSAFAAAIAPISGRLAASRSPPQPNTHQSWPARFCASGRKASRVWARASGVWA